jgi:hypothetical protein
VQFAAKACPSKSRIGRAEVETPLLDSPLTGSVYLRSSSNRLPDLVLDLSGQIDIELAGRVDAVDGRLRTTFDDVPDAPVSVVKLDLFGGSKGLVINSETLCGRTKRATVRLTGQNGDVVSANPVLQSSCSGNARRKRGHAARAEGKRG